MNLVEVKNEDLEKITYNEVDNLRLNNVGIMTYYGVLKSKNKGLHKRVISENQIYFENNEVRWEIIKIISESGKMYAIRFFDKIQEKYEKYQRSTGKDFF